MPYLKGRMDEWKQQITNGQDYFNISCMNSYPWKGLWSLFLFLDRDYLMCGGIHDYWLKYIPLTSDPLEV